MSQLSLFSTDDYHVKRTILLCIQKEYWDRILKNSKRYEYRRIFPDDPINAFIYAPAPHGKLVGYIEFGKPIYDTVDDICKIAEGESRGSTKGMKEYMQGLDKGYAIPISTYEQIKGVDLKTIRKTLPNFNPPQSYLILNDNPTALQYFQTLRGQR